MLDLYITGVYNCVLLVLAMIYRKGPQWSFPKQHNKISMKQVKRLTQVFDDFKHYSIVELSFELIFHIKLLL